MKVKDLMTAEPKTVCPTDALSLVEAKMREGRFRRVLVVDDRAVLLGIVTDRDLRQHTGYLATTKVSAAMRENPITVTDEAAIEAAAQLMIWHKIGGLPVVDDSGRLVGIITESDLLLALVDARNARQSANSSPTPIAPQGSGGAAGERTAPGQPRRGE